MDIPRLRELIKDILPQNDMFNGFELDHKERTSRKATGVQTNASLNG
ncbi:hypothetical protein KKA14_20700 [bacterium]|nr:hypothetical protein [bacterium]